MAPYASCCFAVFTMWCELNNCLLFFIFCQNTDYFSLAETFEGGSPLCDSAPEHKQVSQSLSAALFYFCHTCQSWQVSCFSCQATCLFMLERFLTQRGPFLPPQGPLSRPCSRRSRYCWASRKWLRWGFLWPECLKAAMTGPSTLMGADSCEQAQRRGRVTEDLWKQTAVTRGEEGSGGLNKKPQVGFWGILILLRSCLGCVRKMFCLALSSDQTKKRGVGREMYLSEF